MLDRSGFWPAPQPSETTLTGEDLIVRLLPPVPQVMVSGTIDRFCEIHGLGAAAGLLAPVALPRYALRLARHRMLAVGISQDRAAAGWAEGVATTPMTGAIAVVEILGARALQLFARASAIDPGACSPSAALIFAGHPAAICRSADGLRLHIDRGLVTFLFDWIAETGVVAAGY